MAVICSPDSARHRSLSLLSVLTGPHQPPSCSHWHVKLAVQTAQTNMNAQSHSTTVESSCSRVFLTSELISEILSYNSQADNVRCVRVCKNWHETALDYIWKDLDNLPSLLQTLAPLRGVIYSRNRCYESFVSSTLCRGDVRLY